MIWLNDAVCAGNILLTQTQKKYLVINNNTIDRHGVYDAYCEDCYLDNIDEIRRLNSKVKCFDFSTNYSENRVKPGYYDFDCKFRGVISIPNDILDECCAESLLQDILKVIMVESWVELRIKSLSEMISKEVVVVGEIVLSESKDRFRDVKLVKLVRNDVNVLNKAILAFSENEKVSVQLRTVDKESYLENLSSC